MREALLFGALTCSHALFLRRTKAAPAVREPEENGRSRAREDAGGAAATRDGSPLGFRAAGRGLPPPPSLGRLAAEKLVRAGRTGLLLAIASLVLSRPVHRALGLPRGAIRGRVWRIVEHTRERIAGILLIPGTGFLAVFLTVLGFAWARGRLLRPSHAACQGRMLDVALESLGADLHAWAQKSAHFQTFSEHDIGWLANSAPPALRQNTPDLTEAFFKRLQLLRLHGTSATGMVQKLLWHLGLARRPKLTRTQLINALGVPLCRGGWDGLSILLVPGLLTKWYPLYFTSLRHGLERLGFDVRVSQLDTDASVRANAEVLRAELAAENPRRFVVYAHSKGAVDVLAALAMFPECKRNVAAVVSAQGPHGGSWLVNDIAGTKYQKAAVALGIERLLAGSRDALFDLTYENRRAFFAQWPQQVWCEVPTLCLATCATHQPRALLSPVVEYMRYRYGDAVGATDGCVALRDAMLPGAPVVWLHDMDHYGPAWNAFPATDRYDKTHVCLALISMALEIGMGQARQLASQRYRRRRQTRRWRNAEASREQLSKWLSGNEDESECSDSSSLDPAAPAEGQTLARRIESLRRAQARERDAAAVNRSRSVPSDLATTLLHLGGRW